MVHSALSWMILLRHAHRYVTGYMAIHTTILTIGLVKLEWYATLEDTLAMSQWQTGLNYSTWRSNGF